MPVTVHIAVEDVLSEAVLRRLLREAPGKPTIGAVYPIRRAWDAHSGPHGYGYIRKNLPAFNAASKKNPYVLLVDLDDNVCAPKLIKSWRGGMRLRENLLLRVAVREVEAWLLGDIQGMADALHITRHYFPQDPERIKDPKRYIVRHALRSRLAGIRSDVAPSLGSNGKTGPYFTRFLCSFARDSWDVDVAATRCSSLQRARAALATL